MNSKTGPSKTFLIYLFFELTFFIKMIIIMYLSLYSDNNTKKISLPSETYFYYNLNVGKRKCALSNHLEGYQKTIQFIFEDFKNHKGQSSFTILCKTKVGGEEYNQIIVTEIEFAQIYIYYFKNIKCEDYIKKNFKKGNENFYKIECLI